MLQRFHGLGLNLHRGTNGCHVQGGQERCFFDVYREVFDSLAGEERDARERRHAMGDFFADEDKEVITQN